MNKVLYYRDEKYPFFELKICTDNLSSNKNHSHDEISLGIINKGETYLEYEGKKIFIEPKDAIFLSDNIIHKCNFGENQELEFKMIYIDKKWFDTINNSGNTFFCDNTLKEIKISLKKLNIDEMKTVDLLVRNLTLEDKNKEEILIEILDIVIGFDEYYDNKDIDGKESYINFEKIKNIINKNFKNKISLETLSEITGLSKYYIIKLFKDKSKTTPHAYQTMLRINYAKKELGKNRKISDIAYEIGFYDQSHFTKTFKEYFGITPQEYKNNNNFLL